MSRGLKVFLWIASALTVGVVLGFAGFVVSWAVAGPQQGGSLVETLPEESQPDSSQEGQDAAETPEIELPDVDVTPNEEGITIHEKPEGEALDAQEVYNQVVKSTVHAPPPHRPRPPTAPVRASSPPAMGISSPTPMWC